MRKPALLIAAMLAFSLTLFGTVTAAGKPSDKSQKLTAEIVSVDPMAKTITIKDGKSENRTVTATGKASMYIRNLKPGDKAVLTCQQDDKGEIKNINSFKVVKK